MVHFEAPLSEQVMQEMDGFMKWFQDTAPDGSNPLPALTRAGIAHLYFVCIHPLKDGNGRIGRAIAEKVLAQNFGQPTLIALSHTIQKHKKAYYDALEHNIKGIEVTAILDRKLILTISKCSRFSLFKSRYFLHQYLPFRFGFC